MNFILKHENDNLAVFKYENGNILGLILIEMNITKLPLLKLNSKSVKDNLIEWLRNRGIPVTRQRIQVDLQGLNKSSVFEYMLDNMGLSLTDHYWICPEDKNFTWERVNLYTNDFKSAYSLDLRDDIKTIAGKTNFVPSASLQGDLKKKWIIDNYNVRRLVKGNYTSSCRQSLCEVLATEIHKRQGKVEYTPYSLIEISSDNQKIIGCECPNFTDINTEFIPAIDIINSISKVNRTSDYEAYINYCSCNGINEIYIRNFMEYQILTDFIITNVDRHWNNFGVIRDSKTLRLLKPAPIYDSGNSMFYNTNQIKVDYGLLNIDVNSFKKKEIKLLEYVKNPCLVDLNLLPSKEEVKYLFMKDFGTKEEVIDKLVRAYTRKVDFLRELQGGVKIYSYNYLNKHNVKLR